MNYELLTIIVSSILLLVTFMQYFNSKHNFLKEKMPIIIVNDVKGIYYEKRLKIILAIENIGDSPAVDIIFKSDFDEKKDIKYEKVNFLKEGNKVLIELFF